MTEFFQTLMGRKFYEAHVPRIAESLDRIATQLERICPVTPTFWLVTLTACGEGGLDITVAGPYSSPEKRRQALDSLEQPKGGMTGVLTLLLDIDEKGKPQMKQL